MTPLGAPEGESQEFPDWYVLMKAAQWVGVPPWELANRPRVWRQWAIMGMAAEGRAAKAKQPKRKKGGIG